MEGKRVAALCCLLIVLLSGQQVSASLKSRFCDCYKTCYPDCRNHLPRWLCVLKCMDDCSPTAKLASPTSAGDCNNVCQSLRLCGGLMSATGTTDAQVCLNDCNRNRGRALPAAHLN